MKESADELLQILLHANQLKRTSRTGWVQRGVPNAENVAGHSYGVAFATLLLSRVVEESINLERALVMALLHDLPEGLTSDIPPSAWRLLPTGSKFDAEQKAMQIIVDEMSFYEDFMAILEEYQAADTLEARLVHDADKIDLLLQAQIYEEQTGNRQLQEFWENPAEFHLPEAQALYRSIKRRRRQTQSHD